jgi:hypothetical protein
MRSEISRRHGPAAVPRDAATLAVMRRWFFARKPDAGFILTDFPATLLQAQVFDEWLEARDESLHRLSSPRPVLRLRSSSTTGRSVSSRRPRPLPHDAYRSKILEGIAACANPVRIAATVLSKLKEHVQSRHLDLRLGSDRQRIHRILRRPQRRLRLPDRIAPFPGLHLHVSVNEEVVHGIGSLKRILRDGDIVSLDVTVECQRLHR